MDIGKLFYVLFEKDNCSRKAEATLKKTQLMNNVFPGMQLTIIVYVFSCKNQECD